MIRLSLIIATYNRAGQMLRALESVVAQDAPASEWECVVVNNNSQDDTRERFAAFAAQHPDINLRMVTETRQGLSHARNRGIAETTGDLIAIIDDDEHINPGFVRAYIAFFDAWPGADAAAGNAAGGELAHPFAQVERIGDGPLGQGRQPVGTARRIFRDDFPAGRVYNEYLKS